MSCKWGSQKITSRIGVSWTHSVPFCFRPIFLTQVIMAILSKYCKPGNFQTNNSLKLSLTNICDLCLNFVECESFLESNSPDLLALCETNLDDSKDSGNFSVRGYLPLIWKDSVTHMHGLALYVKEGLSFAQVISLENSVDSYLCFWQALLHSLLHYCIFCPTLLPMWLAHSQVKTQHCYSFTVWLASIFTSTSSI